MWLRRTRAPPLAVAGTSCVLGQYLPSLSLSCLHCKMGQQRFPCGVRVILSERFTPAHAAWRLRLRNNLAARREARGLLQARSSPFRNLQAQGACPRGG